ncbi:MotA/TolQ/ExbB proton channel family protein [Aureibacter tunicatorum]|uniref:Biopolymer transport protein ExbB/TolQ n=1 Tax=Aureibacter tunicatorum TaxID=866807 RepID=A0AAE4BTB8_9BACT|nr:MotA/TolQ/ExbB proton channel family protein [Aureibacter tunicatorum]MDR6242034.1 biopolymer transport protein ExbB/TolQ [Aureibacter tunicatorum]BDD07122.1 membrane protein [Aureibacter tunicatorum]
MEIVTNILYWISTALLLPVTLGLVLLFARSLFYLGEMYSAYSEYRKNKKDLFPALNEIIVEDEKLSALKLKVGETKGQLPEAVVKLLSFKESFVRREKVLSDYELISEKRISIPKSLAKLGPTLGLMGTLIPMGPALVGLSTGDIASMAHNMQVAFATTVVGLIIGAIGFVCLQARQRWTMEELSQLEFIHELIKEEDEKKKVYQ